MFNSVMFFLNGLHLSWLVAGVRFLLSSLLYRWREFGEYGPADQVPGYIGWYRYPIVGVLIFVRDDGELQFRW